MPLLNLKTNISISDKHDFARQVSAATASAVGKSENYVMVLVEDEHTLLFSGNDEPAAYIELKSINLPESETGAISSSLCQLIDEQLHIEKNRIYIEFSNAARHMWGWNGATF